MDVKETAAPGPPAPLSVLTLRHVIPEPYATEQWAQVRPLIDGHDVLEEIHPGGVSSCSRAELSGPPGTWPLTAAAQPREVELSNNDCVTACCGGVFVTIARLGDRVRWSDWRNTDDIRTPVPPDVVFDAARYDAELARAAADTGWEEPVDAVARLLARALAENGWPQRWGCVLDGVSPDREEPSAPRVEVRFHAASDTSADFSRSFPVTPGEPPGDQARRHLATIMSGDPREGG
ncbi:hypothetical protein [Streptomyces sp. ODS05-4]|uniref:hypothetical protein n=1 Tax=Streptomyces sp. ODS05-4 TaxID=2944939 RepID=UPI00210A4843|nr:hypothetical protein [Streptomyces sp. ODS05-4]